MKKLQNKNIVAGEKREGKGKLFLGISKLLLIAIIIAASLLLFGCGDDSADTPEDSYISAVYYNPEGAECELTLDSDGKFTLVYNGGSFTGAYSLSGESLSLDFNSREDLSATFGDGVVALTIDGASLCLIEKIDYTVKFETGSAYSISSLKVSAGKRIEKPNDPKREGYLFVGWYRDSEGKTPFSFSSDVINADTTLYARWIEDTGAREYTVSFELGYEGAETLPSVSTVGARLFSLTSPEREGFVFSGWWVSTEGNYERLSYRVSEDTVFSSDTTLYALWQKKGSDKLLPPSLSVNSDGVSFVSVNGARSYEILLVDSYGTVLFEKSTSAFKADIPFCDYAAGVYYLTVTANANTGEEDSSAAYYTYVNKGLERVDSFFVEGDSTLVFGAVENAERYLITVVCANPDHRHTDYDNGSSTTFCFANCPMTENGIKFTVKAVREGYYPSVSEEFIFKRELDSVDGFTWSEEDSVLSFSPVAGADYYVATVECSDKSHSHVKMKLKDTFISLKECPTGQIKIFVYPAREGYISPSVSEFSVNKTAMRTPSNIKVSGTILSFEAATGALIYEISVNGAVYESENARFDLAKAIDSQPYMTCEVSVRAKGSVNSAWSDTLSCVVLAFNEAPRYSNGRLYWNTVIGADFYEVSVNGGEIFESRENFAKITLTRAGENTVSVRFAYGESLSEWSSVTVNAYSVIFDTLGGSSIGNGYYALGDEISLPVSEKIGYDFVSWYNSPKGPLSLGKEFSDGLYTVSDNATLYAYYNPKKYEVTYNYGLGGGGSLSSSLVEFERDFCLEVPTANDITTSFGGWFSSPYGKGTQYTDGSGKSLTTWNIPEGATVYAFWIDETLEFTPVKVNGKDAYSVSAGPRITLVSEVTVPAYRNGIPVAMIEGNAFIGCKSLVTLNIPETVEVISTLDPFLECTSLSNLNVYEVDGVGSPRYKSIDGVLFEIKPEGLSLIRMPMGREGAYTVVGDVFEIFDGAFTSSSLTAITVSHNVTRIGNDAFSGAIGLSSVSFAASDSARELVIGKRAFDGCLSLKNITLPMRLSSIELSKYYITDKGAFAESPDYAFVGCSSLENISVEAGSKYYSVVDGMIYSRDGSELIYCPTAKSGVISIRKGTQSIGAGAFVGCPGITEIIIPNTVTYIGEYAFSRTSIEKVTFGGKGFSSVTVGDRAFAECKSLYSVVLEEGSQVAVIGEGAFSGCSSLPEFTISPSVSLVRDNAFENCTSLASVTFEGGKKPLEFGKSVFYNCISLTTVEIPANVSKIPGIFTGCTSLTEVKIDSNNPYFEGIEGVVFTKDMTELVYYPEGKGGEYIIPDTVTTIAAGVFYGNKALTSLTIPLSVSYIGEEAFKNTDIRGIVFEGGNMAEELIIAKSAFEGARFEGYDLVLPPHTGEIGERAFAEIFYQNIVLNEGLELIGDYAFYFPSNVNGKDLVIPSSVKKIGEYAFSGESYESSYLTAHRFMNVVFITENSALTEIGDYAFYKNARITSVVLPDSVKTIGNYAFYECRSLNELTLSSSLESIGAYAFAASANTYKVPISALVIPSGVSYIGARAFENCQLLTRVVFEGTENSPDLVLGSAYQRRYETDGVEMFSIERGSVFASCTRLTEVILSPNIVALGDYSFMQAGDTGFKVVIPKNSRLATIGSFCFYKSRLVSFTVPASVRNLEPIEELGSLYNRLGIGDYAFAVSVGKLTEIIFESDENNYPLTIGYGAFENQSLLESIRLPRRLSSYVSADGEVIPPLSGGALVFYGARSLSEISVEDGAPYKVEGGVLYTSDMKTLVFCPMAKCGKVTVPSSVVGIEDYAFVGCVKVSAVDFTGKSSLTSIGDYAFFGCSLIRSLTLPSGVVSIGEGAFNNAVSLEGLTLSKSLENFDISTLSGCASLLYVYVEEGNVRFSSDGGVLYSFDRTSLILYPVAREDKEYVINEKTLSIGKDAFMSNAYLESVVLPSGLCEICDGAFSGCSSLKTVSVPSRVEVIGDRAFKGASSLTSLTFISGGEYKLVIGNEAFLGSGVGSVVFPSRLAYIGIDAFRNSSISALSFDLAEEYHLTEIGAGAFAETPIVSVSLPSSLLTVGDGAFLNTKELQSIILGDGLTAVGKEAFKGSSLVSVRLPKSLTSLGAFAFADCLYLEDVVFEGGSQISKISEGTFSGCVSLESVSIPEFVTEIGGGRDSGAFFGCTSLKSVNFEGDGYLALIGDYAFSGCSSLKEFYLPMSVGTLGAYAFSDCVALTDITIHRSAVKLGEGLFMGCKSLSFVELDTGADTLPASMFENCESLTKITIPGSVSEIGDRAFHGTSIESFDIAEENLNFVSVSGIIYNSSKTVIVCFPPKLKITTLVIPKEVVEIKASNFRYCTSIKEVIFEEGGTVPLSIGNYAFDGCYEIRRVVLPERLVSIGKYAFRECYGLTSITIPKNVESIGTAAFSKCYKLYDVYNESKIENITKDSYLNAINLNSLVGAKVNIYTPTEGASVIYRRGDFIFTTVSGGERLIGYEGNDSVIVLPDGAYEVAPYMFCNDNSITKVIVPNTVKMSGNFVFDGCDNLEVIFVKGEIPASFPERWNNGHRVFSGYTGEKITYTFNIDGVAPIVSDGLVRLPTPEREGEVFMGWYTDSSLIGEAVGEYYYSSEKTSLYASFMNESEYIEKYLRGQSMEYAYEIISGTKYTVDIREKGAKNYFVITVTAGEVLNIATPSGMGYHKLWIYDSEGKVVGTYYSTTSGSGYDINYDYVFTRDGTYYIGVGYKDSNRKPGTFEVTFTEK